MAMCSMCGNFTRLVIEGELVDKIDYVDGETFGRKYESVLIKFYDIGDLENVWVRCQGDFEITEENYVILYMKFGSKAEVTYQNWNEDIEVTQKYTATGLNSFINVTFKNCDEYI